MKALNKKKLLLIIISAICIIFLTILLLFKSGTYQNPYPYGTTIDNISSYLPDIPQKSKDKLFYYLYNFIKQDPEENTPTSGALIRDEDLYVDEEYSVFIVDIESIRTSIRITFWYDENSYVENDILFSCLSPEEKIYEEDSCYIQFTTDDASVIWNHSYLLEYGLAVMVGRIFNTINPYISSYKEASTAPNTSSIVNFFTATIDEYSFKTTYLNSDVVKSFNININDERSYEIALRVDDLRENYLAIYIHRTDLDGHDAGYILSNNKQHTNMLTDWIQSYNPNVTPEIKDF